MADSNRLLSYCDKIPLVHAQAVLKYLQECLNKAEEGEQPDSSDSIALSKRTVPLHPIDNRFSLVASTHLCHKNNSLVGSVALSYPSPVLRLLSVFNVGKWAQYNTRFFSDEKAGGIAIGLWTWLIILY